MRNVKVADLTFALKARIAGKGSHLPMDPPHEELNGAMMVTYAHCLEYVFFVTRIGPVGSQQTYS